MLFLLFLGQENESVVNAFVYMIKVLKAFSLVTVFVWSLPTMAATSCSAGYYLSGSTCVICPAGYYCTNSKKTACTGTTYSDTQGASSCKTCPTAVYLKDKVSFYHYWTDDDMHDTIGGCHVFLKDTYVVNGSVESGSMICYIGSDNDYGATRNVCQILLSKIKCNAGYWNFQYQQQ